MAPVAAALSMRPQQCSPDMQDGVSGCAVPPTYSCTYTKVVQDLTVVSTATIRTIQVGIPTRTENRVRLRTARRILYAARHTCRLST